MNTIPEMEIGMKIWAKENPHMIGESVTHFLFNPSGKTWGG